MSIILLVPWKYGFKVYNTSTDSIAVQWTPHGRDRCSVDVPRTRSLFSGRPTDSIAAQWTPHGLDRCSVDAPQTRSPLSGRIKNGPVHGNHILLILPVPFALLVIYMYIYSPAIHLLGIPQTDKTPSCVWQLSLFMQCSCHSTLRVVV